MASIWYDLYVDLNYFFAKPRLAPLITILRVAIEAGDMEHAWSLLLRLAEDLLGLDGAEDGRPRDKAPKPVQKRGGRRRGTEVEGFNIRRLLRLRRKVLELQRLEGPPPSGLEKNIQKCVEGLVKKYPTFAELEWLDKEALACLSAIIEEARVIEKEDRLRRWRQKIDNEEGELLKWIKQMPAEAAAIDSNKPLHPQDRVEFEAKAWEKLWNPEDVPKVWDLGPFMSWTEEYHQPFELPWLTGKELMRIVRANAGKASGVDNWGPLHWCLLPQGFFDAMAAIWNTILHAGARMPNAWLDVRVVLIPKEGTNEKRPLSIAVMAWRAGISALLARMREWIANWVPEEVAGGVPGRSAAELHDVLQESIWECLQTGEPFAGCKVDCAKHSTKPTLPRQFTSLKN